MNFSNNDIKKAAQVSEFMLGLRNVDKERYEEATKKGIPHGDLAYGAALVDWIRKGKPSNAWFSYAKDQKECALLIAFRKEISAEFGLEILTCEEGEARRKKETLPIITKKVNDWHLN